MGKRGRTIGLVLAMTICMANPVWAKAQETEESASEWSESRIEQVYVDMPELVMYGSGLTAEEIQTAEAYLSQEKLTLQGIPERFSDSGEGICYYVLLDISGSIPKTYFAGMKEAVQSLQAELRGQDRLILYTFGDEVTLAADGSQTDEELAEMLGELKNNNQETLLFEAIHQVASGAQNLRKDGFTRKVLLVMSDGEDFAVGKKQAQEAQTALKEQGIPAYAFGIRDTKKEYLNSFGEFARNSGGELVIFQPEDGAQMFVDLQQSLLDDVRAQYRASSNLVTYQEEIFSLKFPDDRLLKRPVMSNYWIPDEEAPRLLSTECVGPQQLRLVFSEPLKGLDGSANYLLTSEGQPIGVMGISYDKSSSSVVNLSLAEPVKNGSYELALINITDISMEENAVEGTGVDGAVVITVSDAPEEPSQMRKPPQAFDYTGVLFLIFMAVIALILVIVVMQKKAKQKAADGNRENPSAQPEEQLAMIDPEFKQHVVVNPAAKKRLDVKISVNGLVPQQTVWELGTSLIVGRSSICDIHFDDQKMSRQHFSLEREGEIIYINDLNSLNGTSVNGIQMKNRRRLEAGDVIEAGSVKITIRW